MDMGKKPFEKENTMYSSAAFADTKLPSISSNYLSNGRDDKGLTYASMERERFEMKNSYNDSSSQKMNSYSQNDTDEKVQKVSPPRRKGYKDEKSERPSNLMKRDTNGSDLFTASSKQQTTGNHNTVTTGSRLYEAESAPDGNINAVIEVCIIIYKINNLLFTSFQLNIN
jgi:kinesin family protein 2/24